MRTGVTRDKLATGVMKSRAFASLACIVGWLVLMVDVHPVAQSGRPGDISFPTSGAAAAQPYFRRGVEALHNFEYEDANDAFQQAQRTDPGFVMAYWGETMGYNQTLWRNENVEAARQVLARLGPTAEARAAKAKVPKEQAFLAAVEILFGEGDAMTRRRNYANAMGRLYEKYPDDPEVASFYALALLGTMSRSLIGFTDAHEGHSAGLAGSDTQKTVGTILESVLRSHPEHVGALHYLLHNYDDPAHARLALGAARTYAKVAPESSHARHMPAHIFLQLGMWHEAASSDRSAFSASNEWIARKGFGREMRNYHALAWLEYELLQLGRYREARETIDELEPVVKASGSTTLLSDLSSMRARFVVETRRWNMMASEQNFGNVNDLFAIGVSAARAGNPGLAEKARQALAQRAQSPQEGDLRPAIAIMAEEVAALIELKAGRSDTAVNRLQSAQRAELQVPPPLGLPAPLKPAPELLGEVLLEVGRPREAIEPFEHALRRNANRSLSLLGLARAKAAIGDAEAARERYRALLANFDRADADVPELREARAAVNGTGSRSSVAWPGKVPSIAIGAILLAGFACWRFVTRAGRTEIRARAPRAERRRRARGAR